MSIKTKAWDPLDFLNSEENITSYLEAAFEDGDPALITAALGDVARARGMSKIAQDTGLTRESLYRSLSAGGNPSFATVVKVTEELGYSLHVVRKTDSPAALTDTIVI